MINLKEFAIAYVYEHDNLSSKDRRILCDFIVKESNDKVKNLLLTGQMKNTLTEADMNLIEITWDDIPDLKLQDGPTMHGELRIADLDKVGRPGGKVLAVTALAALATIIAMKTYKRFLTQAARSCKGKSGAEKTICMKKFEKQGIQKKIDVFKKAMSKCGNTKDPRKCQLKLKNKIEKSQLRIKKLS